MSLNCANVFSQLPDTCKDGNGLLLPRDLEFTTSGQSFATKSDAGDESNWITGIVNDEIFPVKGIKETEDLTAESSNWESASGDIVYLYEGKVRMKFTYYLTVEQHQALRSYSGKNGKVYVTDRKGNIMGTSPDGVGFQGFSTSYVNVETLKPATADTPALSVIEIQFENPEEFNETLAVIEPYTGTAANKWYPSNLPNKTKVVVTQDGSIAVDVVTFDVQYQSGSVTDNDGNPVTNVGIAGLDVTTFTNFQFVVGGVVTAPSSMTDEGSGRYTATVTGIAAADTIQIVATADNLYYSDATAVS